MKMDTAKLVVFRHFISVLIFSFGLEFVTSSRDLALHKTATQSSTYIDTQSYDAGRAVDGVPGRDVGGGHCSHTGIGHHQAWWKVDLGEVYRIQTINITYRRDFTRRLYGYYLYVTNHTDMAVGSNDTINTHLGHLCYHDNGSALPNYIQSRPCYINGRYVIFYNKRPVNHATHPSISDAAYISLCEVQVFDKSILRGYYLYVSNMSYTNSFSQAHTSMCFHDNTTSTNTSPSYIKSHPCSVNGRYVIVYNNRTYYNTANEHHINYAPTEAVVELCDVQVLGCPLNRFAANCNKTCHCKIGGCHSDTGVCDMPGCQDGWTAENCSVCVNNRYGSGCKQECHCMTEGCDMVTGRCTQPGCQNGWKGDVCDRVCDTNHCGPDCTKQCHCKTEGCNRLDGTCHVIGCQDGWMGKSCDQMCDTNHFGPDCTKQCHCKTEGCNRIDGACNVTGCQDGWMARSCDKKCSTGHFGRHCFEVCHCQQEGCDHANGRCHQVGCQAGWSGQACDHQCGGNAFGRDCRETCHCASSGCDRVSGVCTISGCTEGWTGDTCSQVCVADRFGKDCLLECHCQMEGCDNVDGTCNVTGCVDGWRGKSCDQTCDFIHYGPNCLYECHCNISGCSNTNGLCQTPGCEDGWTGPSCSDAKEQKSSTSDCPQIAEVSTCATGYALLGTFLAISISFNIGFTIQRVRMRFTNSRTKPPSKELQTYHIPNHENSYEGLDSTKIDKTRNIYDTIVQ